MVNWSKMYCRHIQPIFSGAIILSWLRLIGKNSMTFLRTTTCYRLLSMQTVGDILRNGSCPFLWSSRRVLQAHAGLPWVTYSESRIDDLGITATEFPYSSSNTTVAATNSTLYVVNHHATRGYIAYHVGSAIKELWRNEKDMQKRTQQLFIYFIMTKCTC